MSNSNMQYANPHWMKKIYKNEHNQKYKESQTIPRTGKE